MISFLGCSGYRPQVKHWSPSCSTFYGQMSRFVAPHASPKNPKERIYRRTWNSSKFSPCRLKTPRPLTGLGVPLVNPWQLRWTAQQSSPIDISVYHQKPRNLQKEEIHPTALFFFVHQVFSFCIVFGKKQVRNTQRFFSNKSAKNPSCPNPLGPMGPGFQTRGVPASPISWQMSRRSAAIAKRNRPNRQAFCGKQQTKSRKTATLMMYWMFLILFFFDVWCSACFFCLMLFLDAWR